MAASSPPSQWNCIVGTVPIHTERGVSGVSFILGERVVTLGWFLGGSPSLLEIDFFVILESVLELIL